MSKFFESIFGSHKKSTPNDGRYVRLPDDYPDEVPDEIVLGLLHLGLLVISRARLESPANTVTVEFDFEGETVRFRVTPVGRAFEYSQVRP